mmetsp:Transcript_64528/g.173485  ORF Transcript_64528/g.173485 Transcript_64528/m.173485 type:complete len:232 (-) Transcript_64528:293-988(-)
MVAPGGGGGTVGPAVVVVVVVSGTEQIPLAPIIDGSAVMQSKPSSQLISYGGDNVGLQLSPNLARGRKVVASGTSTRTGAAITTGAGDGTGANVGIGGNVGGNVGGTKGGNVGGGNVGGKVGASVDVIPGSGPISGVTPPGGKTQEALFLQSAGPLTTSKPVSQGFDSLHTGDSTSVTFQSCRKHLPSGKKAKCMQGVIDPLACSSIVCLHTDWHQSQPFCRVYELSVRGN